MIIYSSTGMTVGQVRNDILGEVREMEPEY
jgi:hypothetical protein